MIIQPGVEQPSVANMIELVRKDAVRRINVELQDATGSIIDIETGVDAGGDPKGELDVEITTVGGDQIYSEAYNPPPQLTDPRIKKQTTGKYYISYGTETLETSTAQALLFNWHSRQHATAEDVYRTQVVEIVSPRSLGHSGREWRLSRSRHVSSPRRRRVLSTSENSASLAFAGILSLVMSESD